jgi:hypothetical protein
MRAEPSIDFVYLLFLSRVGSFFGSSVLRYVHASPVGFVSYLLSHVLSGY